MCRNRDNHQDHGTASHRRQLGSDRSELKQAFGNHRKQIEEHARRLEQILDEMDESPQDTDLNKLETLSNKLKPKNLGLKEEEGDMIVQPGYRRKTA